MFTIALNEKLSKARDNLVMAMACRHVLKRYDEYLRKVFCRNNYLLINLIYFKAAAKIVLLNLMFLASNKSKEQQIFHCGYN
jgi:hypothetical protein